MVLLFEHNFLPASASLLSTIIFRFIATDFVEFEFIYNTNSSFLAFYFMLCSVLCIENGIRC